MDLFSNELAFASLAAADRKRGAESAADGETLSRTVLLYMVLKRQARSLRRTLETTWRGPFTYDFLRYRDYRDTGAKLRHACTHHVAGLFRASYSDHDVYVGHAADKELYARSEVGGALVWTAQKQLTDLVGDEDATDEMATVRCEYEFGTRKSAVVNTRGSQSASVLFDNIRRRAVDDRKAEVLRAFVAEQHGKGVELVLMRKLKLLMKTEAPELEECKYKMDSAENAYMYHDEEEDEFEEDEGDIYSKEEEEEEEDDMYDRRRQRRNDDEHDHGGGDSDLDDDH